MKGVRTKMNVQTGIPLDGVIYGKKSNKKKIIYPAGHTNWRIAIMVIIIVESNVSRYSRQLNQNLLIRLKALFKISYDNLY